MLRRIKRLKLNRQILCWFCFSCFLGGICFVAILRAFQLDSYYEDSSSCKAQSAILHANDIEIFLLKSIRFLKRKDSYSFLFKPKAGDWGSLTKSMAAFNLGEIKNKQSVKALISALKSKDNLIVMNAAEALGKIGDKKATSSLISLLNHNDNGVRLYAIIALGDIHAKESVPQLKNIFEAKNECFTIKNAAYNALHKILGKERTLKELNAAKINEFEEILQARIKHAQKI